MVRKRHSECSLLSAWCFWWCCKASRISISRPPGGWVLVCESSGGQLSRSQHYRAILYVFPFPFETVAAPLRLLQGRLRCCLWQEGFVPSRLSAQRQVRGSLGLSQVGKDGVSPRISLSATGCSSWGVPRSTTPVPTIAGGRHGSPFSAVRFGGRKSRTMGVIGRFCGKLTQKFSAVQIAWRREWDST